MQVDNAFYAQSGGVTAVINHTAQAVIETAATDKRIGKVLAGRNGILGALQEALIDTSVVPKSAIKNLAYTPGGVFGSCRYKLKSEQDCQRIIEVFAAHRIKYFFYNGGGDSQDTTHKLAQFSQQVGYPLTCIGIPKTIDNDLPWTDTCPGFGSVAKYVATSIREAALDVQSMAATSTKVFIMEVMGRHSGWIAASSGLAADRPGAAPHIILFPEIPFNQQTFLEKVQYIVQRYHYCTIVVSEGLKTSNGQFLSEADSSDAFGHKQLGGVAPILAHMIKKHLHLKYHWAVLDYLQRSARHIVSAVDLKQAYQLGKTAVQLAMQGKQSVMPIIVRTSNQPYRWHIDSVPLQDVANIEKKLPKKYIRADGFHITPSCKAYLAPLIQGEAYPPYLNGLPNYQPFPCRLVKPKLQPYNLL